MNYKVIVVLFLSLYIYGCAKNNTSITTESEQSSNEIAEEKKQPVSISVSQAFFVSHKLKVKLILEAKTNFPANKIAVKISALKEGEVVEEQVKLASEVIDGEEIKADQRIIIPFDLESEDFNEYQIQCSWGQEALALINTKPKTIPLEQKSVEDHLIKYTPEQLKLDNVELIEKKVSCKKKPCPISYSISTVLINKVDVSATNIKLAVGINWAKDDQIPNPVKDFEKIKESEEVIDLEDFELAPFAEKKLKVDIDRELPSSTNGKYYPYIRIVEFSSKK